jgi:DNA polymerase-3 subunit beta
LDVTIRCETDAEEITQPGSICVQAKKLFDIARLLPEATVSFKKEENEWVSVKCENFRSRIPGVSREQFPEVPSFKSAPAKMRAEVFKSLIDRTIFAITQEESRYQLSGAKFVLDDSAATMVTTDGHRLAFIEHKNGGQSTPGEALDALIPRKSLAELARLTTSFEGEISLGADENHIYFEVGPRLLISRRLAGQFPNYEMVMPKGNDKSVTFDAVLLNQAIRRVALMADDRSHAIRFRLANNQLHLASQNAEEGEAGETIAAEYDGEETEIGFNAQYLQDFLNVIGEGQVKFEFKDGNAQAQLRPDAESEFDYKYVVMPMRI